MWIPAHHQRDAAVFLGRGLHLGIGSAADVMVGHQPAQLAAIGQRVADEHGEGGGTVEHAGIAQRREGRAVHVLDAFPQAQLTHEGGRALREKLAFPTKEAIGTALSDLRGHLKSLAPEAAILSTCNRTEIYCKTDAPDEAGQALTEWIGRHKGVDGEGNLAEHLYLLPNQGAVRHAFRVASGLDSMVLGEPQILGQMNLAVNHQSARKMKH